MIKVLLIYEFLIKLCCKKSIKALYTSFVGCQDVVESLMTILDDIWLILDDVIAVLIIHEVDDLESIFAILFVFSSGDKQLQADNLIFGIDIRNGSVEAVSKEIILSFVGNEFIPSKLLDLSSLKSGVNISNSSLFVAYSVIDLHALKNEPTKLVLDGKCEMVPRFLLLHWHVVSFILLVVESFTLVNGHHIWWSCDWNVSWMKVLLIFGRHVARAAFDDFFCLNAENAENNILYLVVWIVLHISIRLAR